MQFGVTAKNNGPNATTQAFTVVDRLPGGLTPTSASGAGFSCAAPVGQSITCTQSPFAALAAGAFAGTITVSATVDSGATGVLKKAGLIHYNAGEITVLDRAGIEKRSCECYGVVKKESERLLPASVELAET